MAYQGAVTTGQLAGYVGASDDAYVDHCLATAETLIGAYLSGYGLLDEDGTLTGVPDEIADRAVLEVASELYHRRNAPNGVAQFATMDAAPIRIARDPMVAARPLLAPYVAGGFG
jgi:hypothetical protein